MGQLWFGGTIYTMQHDGDTVEAVLVESGKVKKVGTYEELKTQAEEVIDLQGAVMYPGFVDSHLHMIGYGEKLLRLDLTNVKSSDELLDVIKQAAANCSSEEWLIAEGWDENQFNDIRIPTVQELDAIRQEPIVLKRICRHVVLANTSAMAAGNITQETPNPEGGEIGRDENGLLTGLLYDQALYKVLDQIPVEQEYSLTNTLELAVNHLLSLGLTGGHTEDMSYYGHFSNPLNAFNEIIGKRKNFRAHLLRHHLAFEQMMTSNATFTEPFVEPGAMKIFSDGALGGATAALLEPYENQPQNKGLFIHTSKQLDQLVKLARSYGEAVAVHIIGDAALEQVLTAIEANPITNGKKDRLIHCSVVNDLLIERMSKLPVILDIQPQFILSDFPWVVDKIGPKRAELTYPFKRFLDKGLICAGGSDAPIEDANPLLGIHAAIARKKHEESHEGYIPTEKLTRFEAISLYTTGSAKVISKEQVRGTIQPGYDADFSIFDKDLFVCELDEIPNAIALKTVVAGNIVFSK
ncbi:amidohydrolase [Viridibacillus sp. FSL H7-0596]|uniref:amidohydrolase n=1 Tax=Viridibacillus sp. FSL H7-0596 TaxID=1928923 RepID=UPI00096E6BA3|nr:amidohydrolase [Viridibacillus sp. FSL H7-0596]OMC88560.1 amidohydrolase [Viridibacillus sp. FSL H7-0596]